MRNCSNLPEVATWEDFCQGFVDSVWTQLILLGSLFSFRSFASDVFIPHPFEDYKSSGTIALGTWFQGSIMVITAAITQSHWIW